MAPLEAAACDSATHFPGTAGFVVSTLSTSFPSDLGDNRAISETIRDCHPGCVDLVALLF